MENQDKKEQPAEHREQDETTHFHWADQIALDVEKRVAANKTLQELVKKQGYFVYDEKTPSGCIHVGSGRGWIIHDAIAKALRKRGLNARFVLSSDDIDPYDKPNKELDASWDKYLGMPFRNIPSPFEGYESFGDYYFYQCAEKFEELGIEVELESTGAEYEKGTFNQAIKTCLDNYKKIQEIFIRYYGEDVDAAKKIPFSPICEKCGKIATTFAYAWDPEKELVSYECKDIKYTKGCSYKGQISPYNGNGKLPWKVEWAAKWPSKGVVCELAGKDHFTKNGSRTIAIAISSEVLKYLPPYPSTETETGKGYEFFNIGGKKMSTSKGQGVPFKDITTVLPPHMVRFLLIRSRPNAVIDFDPNRDNDVIFLYDRYDQTERIYFGKEEANEREKLTHQRTYELSHIGAIPKKMPIQIPFRFAAVVIQTGMSEEGALEILNKLEYIPKKITGVNLHYVTQRLHNAKQWVEMYASDDYKFKLQDNVTVKIDLPSKKALQEVAALLDKKPKIKDKDLHTAFYDICKALQLEPKQFFQDAYKVIINKDRGPQLANFILTIGKEKFAHLVKQL